MKKIRGFAVALIFTFVVSCLTPMETEKVLAKNQSYYDMKQVDQTETSVTIDWTEHFEERYADRKIEKLELLLTEGSFYDKNEVQTFPVEPDARSFTFEELKAGIQYEVELKIDYSFDSGYASSTSTKMEIYTLPGKITGLNQEKWWYWLKQCDVTWDKQPGADGYEYEVRNHKKKKIAENDDEYKSGNRASFKIENNIVYTIKARAYTELNGKKYTGKWSDPAYCFTQPMVNKVSYDKKGGITIKWNKVNGCDEYSVYVSKKKDKGFKKVKTVKAKVTSMRLDKIAGKKVSAKDTYYLYIVGTKKVKGKKYTSGKNYLHTIKNGYAQLGYINVEK